MGPFDYNLLLLRLFYLMPKTADNFKYLGQLIEVLLLCILHLLVSLLVWFPDLSCLLLSLSRAQCLSHSERRQLLLPFHED